MKINIFGLSSTSLGFFRLNFGNTCMWYSVVAWDGNPEANWMFT